MKPPSGISHKLGEVCKLNKAVYGPKQAPRAWSENFISVIGSFGSHSRCHDSALSTCCTSAGWVLLLYMMMTRWHMIVISVDLNRITELKIIESVRGIGTSRYFFGTKLPSPLQAISSPSPSIYLTFFEKLASQILRHLRLYNSSEVFICQT